MIRKSILIVAFMGPEELQLPRTRLRTKFTTIILRQTHIQGVPKVRSSPLKVCISVRLDLVRKSSQQKLCLSI